MHTVSPAPNAGQQLALFMPPPSTASDQVDSELTALLTEMGERLRGYRDRAAISAVELERRVRALSGVRIPKRKGYTEFVGPLLRREPRLPSAISLAAIVKFLLTSGDLDRETATRWLEAAARLRAETRHRTAVAAGEARHRTAQHLTQGCKVCGKSFPIWPWERSKQTRVTCSAYCRAILKGNLPTPTDPLRRTLETFMTTKRVTLNAVAAAAGIAYGALWSWYTNEEHLLTAPLLRRLAEYLGLPYDDALALQGGLTGESRWRGASAEEMKAVRAGPGRADPHSKKTVKGQTRTKEQRERMRAAQANRKAEAEKAAKEWDARQAAGERAGKRPKTPGEIGAEGSRAWHTAPEAPFVRRLTRWLRQFPPKQKPSSKEVLARATAVAAQLSRPPRVQYTRRTVLEIWRPYCAKWGV